MVEASSLRPGNWWQASQLTGPHVTLAEQAWGRGPLDAHHMAGQRGWNKTEDYKSNRDSYSPRNPPGHHHTPTLKD